MLRHTMLRHTIFRHTMPPSNGGTSLWEESDNVDESSPVISDLPVHDQLPTLSEIHQKSARDLPTESWEEATESRWRKRKHLCLLLIPPFFLSAMCVGIVFAAVEGSAGAGKGVGTGCTGTECVINVGSEERAQKIRKERASKYLGGTFSDAAALRDEGSAQARAVQWIANADDMQLVVPDADTEGGEARRFVQRYALAVLYYSLGGADWEDKFGFLSWRKECDWNLPIDDTTTDDWYLPIHDDAIFEETPFYGVTCDDEDRLTSIYMPTNSMEGKIPPEIQFLTGLRILNLSANFIFGSLPPEMAGLTNLETILLKSNNLSGTIPEWLANLTSLKKLSLSSNGFHGYLPDLQFLSELTHLNLSNNMADNGDALTGTIPESWVGMKELQELVLSFNKLIGSLPQRIGDLTHLRALKLSGNYLEGSLPNSLQNCRHLRNLYLNENQFVGGLDPLKYLQTLENVLLQDNSFDEVLTTTFFGFLDDLEVFDASNNKLRGTLPIGFFKNDKLKVLDLNGNNLEGVLPEFPENYSLEHLALQNNGFSEDVPASVSNLRHLTHLDLSNNTFTGSIPASIGSMYRLMRLYLAANAFDSKTPDGTWSPIPDFLQDLASSLTELSLQDTGRTGAVPEWIANMTGLVLLDLRGNALEGTLSDRTFVGMLKLNFLLLDDNRLEGNVPDVLARLPNLRILTVEENNFTALGTSISGFCENLPLLGKMGSIFSADCGFPTADSLNITRKETISCSCCTECCSGGRECHKEVQLMSGHTRSWKRGYIKNQF